MTSTQLSRTQQQIKSHSKLVGPEYFQDTYLTYIYRKIIRISEAVYLTTNHISDYEPLKGKIRTISVDLVNVSVRIRNTKNYEQENVRYDALLTGMADLKSLLEIAVVVGIINESNFFILDREADSIFSSITEKVKNGGYFNVAVTPSFFDIEMETIQTRSNRTADRKGHQLKDKQYANKNSSESIKDIGHVTNGRIKNVTSDVGSEELDVVNKGRVKDTVLTDKGHINPRNALKTVERAGRSISVMNLLKDKQSVSIKDIIMLLPQYSEKTIQRELLKLVKTGFVKKQGVKRWTFYSVIGEV